MNDFIIKNANLNIAEELNNIGFDKSYLTNACNKYKYKNIKIFGLSIPQANILKQCAISVGADCAVHRETITAKVEHSDCVLGGSLSQLQKIAEKLKKQPFKLKQLADLIEKQINFKLNPLKIKQTVFDFSRPYLIGVLNLTQNSFSDGGLYYDFENSIKRLFELIDEGADIIELGAESTKPFSQPIDVKSQLDKLLPILNFIKNEKIEIPISIDTRSAEVAEECNKNGANIINDVSGFDFDAKMLETIAKYDIPIIIQHSKGTPEEMQKNTDYKNLIDEIYLSLKDKINLALNAGIKKENIIIDMGIGFGKTKEQNLEIIDRIEEFTSLQTPIMLGISRKSFLNMSESTNEEKDIYTLALNSRIINKGVNFIRVHNVKLHKKLLAIIGCE